MPKAQSYFEDSNWQDSLVALLCNDVVTLRRCATLLTADDFKPLDNSPHAHSRWLVAQRALHYWQRYHEPVGRLLRSSLLEYAEQVGLGSNQIKTLDEYQHHLESLKLVGSQAINDNVILYKRQRMKSLAIGELIDLQAQNKLTDEKWLDISRKAVRMFDTEEEPADYMEGMANRIARRKHKESQSMPSLLIDPIDCLLRRYIGPGQLGLGIGPWKRGKSMFLIWVALAYVIQRLNVLYLTLEDSGAEVEDRMDSAITGVSFNSLSESPAVLQDRFKRYRLFIRTKLKVVDGRLGGWNMARIDNLVARGRDRGFYPDALIIDYDAKIVPTRSYKERRFEIDSTYMEMLQLGSRYNMILWTAAQTHRDTRNMKILSGDQLAEAINKIQNVTMALSLGKGEWGDNSIFMWVAAHRFDRMEIGANIITNKDLALIYDREATLKKMQEEESVGESGGL
jgi:hypothetical protein